VPFLSIACEELVITFIMACFTLISSNLKAGILLLRLVLITIFFSANSAPNIITISSIRSLMLFSLKSKIGSLEKVRIPFKISSRRTTSLMIMSMYVYSSVIFSSFLFRRLAKPPIDTSGFLIS